MIAIVISRFVAILYQNTLANLNSQKNLYVRRLFGEPLPTGHSPQRLDTGIHVALTLLQPHARMLNSFPLLA